MGRRNRGLGRGIDAIYLENALESGSASGENVITMLRLGMIDPKSDQPRKYFDKEALEALAEYLECRDIDRLHAYTQIMIAPGYRYNIVRAIVTNFHQPKSTLLLLVSAFVGEDWRRIYDYAMENGFRFLSYGDSSLLLP